MFLSHYDFNLYRFRMPIMRALIARGWEVYALAPEGSFSRRFAAEGVRHAPYRIDRASLNPFKEAAVVVSLARILADLKPDLLHSFTMKPNIYGALATVLGGSPRTVASVTGLGSFYAGERRGLAAWGRLGLECLYGAALRRVDRVLFQNRDDLAEMLGRGICREEVCRIIAGSGVDTAHFTPREGPRPQGPITVTMIARLIRDKGVEEYLSAAEGLKDRWGERVVFQLAGEFDEGNLWSVDKARVADFESRGIIRRLGFVEDVRGLLQASDIYVLPSYREGTPMSVLEAMSCGLPVVTTDAVGCRETIIDEESGLSVPVKDAAALGAAIESVISDEELRRRLGAAARIRAEKVFSVKMVVAAHLDLYRELLPEAGLAP